MVRILFILAIQTTMLLPARGQLVVFEGLKKINGTQLYVKIIGKGAPILVVHGGPGMNHSYFLPHLTALAKKNQLIFFDQRASGKSATPLADSISLDFFIDDMEALRKELKLEKITILAHSWGAIPAIVYSLYYPKNLSKLILSNPVPLSSEFNGELTAIQQKRLTRKDSLERTAILSSSEFKSGHAEAYKKLLLLSFSHSFYKSSNQSKLKYDMPANFVSASRALFTGLANDLGRYNFYPRLDEIEQPVLLIHGQADAIPLSIQTKTKESFPQCTLLAFKFSGHFPFIEETERFRKEVTLFLGKK